MQVVLSAKDRERLGCPETLPIDLSTLTNREAVALQQMGFTTIRALHRRLEVKPAADDETDMQLDYAAWDAVIWLALRRAGVDVAFDTLEYDLFGLRIIDDSQPAVDPGKAEAPKRPTSRRR